MIEPRIKRVLEKDFLKEIGEGHLKNAQITNQNLLQEEYYEELWLEECVFQNVSFTKKMCIRDRGIQAKLSIMPPNNRYKLSQTVTKIVNKGSSNLIAFVI